MYGVLVSLLSLPQYQTIAGGLNRSDQCFTTLHASSSGPSGTRNHHIRSSTSDKTNNPSMIHVAAFNPALDDDWDKIRDIMLKYRPKAIPEPLWKENSRLMIDDLKNIKS
ncbi:uncharacterized protein MCYG_06926 [Microsporum canis CBS 113480]|uniref:Uncharacterized protein n=1 Tax=Arthroderma otae (strain ATCC MYA-4605 / CBS 113480) TaxID=554155 RepID=C5FW23_ARTOC|nr:uncharacterized protein MCYG_06926 [Microsporum canis CBS 113480]EEQ34107.1 predicted protein [Microsporum canis CBS 113480]